MRRCYGMMNADCTRHVSGRVLKIFGDRGWRETERYH